MIDERLIAAAETAAGAMHRIAGAADVVSTIAKKVDAVIEAAGGVDGIKKKLSLLDGLANFTGGFSRFMGKKK
ncbi:MAG: hypothetical protein Q8Q14_14795 [Gemmatimonadales bacterium]|nr:hypothetical protein [Gemmatimonadales bacterium]